MRNELRNMSAESLEQLENELRDEASTPEDVFEALERNEKGFVKQSIGNCVFALSHDPLLNGNIRRNELTWSDGYLRRYAVEPQRGFTYGYGHQQYPSVSGIQL